MFPLLLKCTFIPGLRGVVLGELQNHPNLRIIEVGNEEVYLQQTNDIGILRNLKSITNIYIIRQNEKLNPYYISNHKSILGEMIQYAISSSPEKFKTFRLSCAGDSSPEITAIESYITEHYKLTYAEEADMELYIGKEEDVWEIGVRLTTRPLSLRNYRVANIPGGMNPTVAYAMNSLCNLESAQSYLNICSGSGTLMIEAGLINPNLQLTGFDINGKTNALAVQNLKKAGFMKSTQLKTADLLSLPELGTFDVIVSDLPFGMQISKGEDLSELYQAFVHYCEQNLNPSGTLAAYTAEYELLERILADSRFSIIKTLNLRVPTSVGAYMQTKVFVCRFK